MILKEVKKRSSCIKFSVTLRRRASTNTILVVAYVTVLAAACVENAIVIYLVRTYKDLKQSTFNLLIINMAVADLIDVCFATTVSVSFVFVGRQFLPGLVGNLPITYLWCPSCSRSPRSLLCLLIDTWQWFMLWESRCLQQQQKMHSSELDNLSHCRFSLSS